MMLTAPLGRKFGTDIQSYSEGPEEEGGGVLFLFPIYAVQI